MDDDAFDLDAYLARIGYEGARTPTWDTLAAIHAAHARAIPFENIDVVLGRAIALDLASLTRKLVHERRGGYCFEHNTLLAAALRALGFAVTPMLARVRWQVPPEVATPQTHMALRVEIGGRPWLADAGFGGNGLVEPLALDSLEIQETRHEPRRLVPHGRNLLQQVLIAGAWSDVYVLYPDDAYAIDFTVANWFTSAHPESRFRQNLLVARAEGDRRYTLFNRELTVRRLDGTADRRRLGSHEELMEVLAQHFGLHLPAGQRLICPGLVWDGP